MSIQVNGFGGTEAEEILTLDYLEPLSKRGTYNSSKGGYKQVVIPTPTVPLFNTFSIPSDTYYSYN